MRPTPLLFFLVLGIFFQHNAESAMTEAQIKATGKLLRNTCQPKSKTTDEIIEGMHQGNWDMDRTGMCYLHCIFSSTKVLNKDNTFNYDSAMAQIKSLPEGRKEPARICMEQCKDAGVTTSDKCIVGYEIGKCIYDCNPANYLLP
ncbi:general odorant-binding protein 72 [Aethina tumida]|uniref:general odorant-binding protein 72 n=1 Tax=Aethina tumida TaxID=116153 RepID=UPI00096B3AE3|nr:general odorant-binding protein 72 [Aethina tumida]